MATGSGSADFEHVADLPLAARCFLAASLGTFELALADLREDGAEVLVLDDGGLRNLPQLVEGGVRQVEPAVADRQPAVGIIDDGDALAAEVAGDRVWLQQEYDTKPASSKKDGVAGSRKRRNRCVTLERSNSCFP